MNKPKVFFPNLDGLRFLAFFAVYMQHGFGSIAEQVPSLIASLAFGSGWAGVSFFFVLSGFLITYLILSEIQTTGGVDVRAFYIRRALRIWPLYYAVLLFGFAVYPAVKAAIGLPAYIQSGNPLFYLLFLGNFDVIQLGAGHGAMSTNITWSVAIEEQFYLAWPLLFALIPARFYKYTFPLIILASFAFRLVNIDDDMVVYFHSLSVISDMAVGGMVAYLIVRSARFKQYFVTLPKGWIIAVYACGLIAILFRDYLFPGSFLTAAQRLVISLFFAFVVLEQNYSERSLFKMGRFRTVSKLGIYTYGLYLLHPVVLLLLVGVGKVLRIDGGVAYNVALGLAGLAGSILLSLISYHLYEVRFLNLKSRFSRERKSLPDEVTT